MANPLQKPGENPKKPGEYEERGPRGGEVPKPRTVTIEPGDKPLPPTQKPNRRWKPVAPARKK
ncbi:MAG: YjzC family protein [Aggregatilineales bacterium]